MKRRTTIKLRFANRESLVVLGWAVTVPGFNRLALVAHRPVDRGPDGAPVVLTTGWSISEAVTGCFIVAKVPTIREAIQQAAACLEQHSDEIDEAIRRASQWERRAGT